MNSWVFTAYLTPERIRIIVQSSHENVRAQVHFSFEVFNEFRGSMNGGAPKRMMKL